MFNFKSIKVFMFLFLLGLGISLSYLNCSNEKPLIGTNVSSIGYNGIAKTPPMGWEGWNAYFGDCSKKTEEKYKKIADMMIASGMVEAGYVYLRLDECWQGPRDSEGNITAKKTLFPSGGLRPLHDYMKGKDKRLKLGIYTDVGYWTCMGSRDGGAGSYGYEEQDAKKYAEWGIEHVKNDFCGVETGLETNKPFITNDQALEAYKKMGQALAEEGKKNHLNIVYNVCTWGQLNPWNWFSDVNAHSWRFSYDVVAGDTADAFQSIVGIVDLAILKGLRKYAGPGHWNDADMLVAGTTKASEIVAKSQMSMYAILASPLIAGNDLLSVQPGDSVFSILNNSKVIAVNQDPLGLQGFMIRQVGETQLWMKPLENGDRAVAIFNRGSQDVDFEYTFEEVYIAPNAVDRKIIIHDLWSNEREEVRTNFDSGQVVRISSRETRLFRLSGQAISTDNLREGGIPNISFGIEDWSGWRTSPNRLTQIMVKGNSNLLGAKISAPSGIGLAVGREMYSNEGDKTILRAYVSVSSDMPLGQFVLNITKPGLPNHPGSFYIETPTQSESKDLGINILGSDNSNRYGGWSGQSGETIATWVIGNSYLNGASVSLNKEDVSLFILTQPSYESINGEVKMSFSISINQDTPKGVYFLKIISPQLTFPHIGRFEVR